MDTGYYSKEMNNVYGLKLRDFAQLMDESDKADNGYQYVSWVNGLFNDRSERVGWTVSFNHEADDTLYHLLNDKGNERIFKTIDSAVSFLSGLNTITGSNITWC